MSEVVTSIQPWQPTPDTQITATTSSFVLDLQQQLNQVVPNRENDTALGTEMLHPPHHEPRCSAAPAARAFGPAPVGTVLTVKLELVSIHRLMTTNQLFLRPFPQKMRNKTDSKTFPHQVCQRRRPASSAPNRRHCSSSTAPTRRPQPRSGCLSDRYPFAPSYRFVSREMRRPKVAGEDRDWRHHRSP